MGSVCAQGGAYNTPIPRYLVLVACVKVRDRHAVCRGGALLLLILRRPSAEPIHTSGMLRLQVSEMSIALLLISLIDVRARSIPPGTEAV